MWFWCTVLFNESGCISIVRTILRIIINRNIFCLHLTSFVYEFLWLSNSHKVLKQIEKRFNAHSSCKWFPLKPMLLQRLQIHTVIWYIPFLIRFWFHAFLFESHSCLRNLWGNEIVAENFALKVRSLENKIRSQLEIK